VGQAVGGDCPFGPQELFIWKNTKEYLTHMFQQLERQTANALRRKRSKFKLTGFTRDKSRKAFGLRGFTPTGRIMTTAVTLSTTAPTNSVAQPAMSTNSSKGLRDTIYLELAVRARRAMDPVREIELCLESPWDAETDNDAEAILFIAVDSTAKPARFESAAVMAVPGFGFRDAPSGSVIIAADCHAFRYTFFFDEPRDSIVNSFVYAIPQFGILERAGLLFIGVRLGELQAFGSLSVRGAGVPNACLPNKSSPAAYGIMLELVDAGSGDLLYSRFVLLPRKFTSALWRALERQIAAPPGLPLQLQLATNYSAFFNADGRMAECWSAARYISKGTDTPVQRLWIRPCDDLVEGQEMD
jgi:hypothetical protein